MSNPRRIGSDVDEPWMRTIGNYSLKWGDVPSSVAPYVPTPIDVVKKMLKVAGAGPDDVVYDLGCGDGRILFTAVEEFGVRKAVGFDLNPIMCQTVQNKVALKSLNNRIEVVNRNFFLVDLSQATLVTIYLTTSGNTKLKPKFEKELHRGSRVVSHDFPIHGWTTLKGDAPNYFDFGSHKVYLYRVPEAYETQDKITRTPEEESRWRRIRDAFLRHENRG